jgi:general secretion pathway protein F
VASYFFKAVAGDGRVRSGSLPGESEKAVAAELKRQGLIPVFVGAAEQKKGLSLSLPAFGKSRRKDVLFFTQELSTLLNAGIPVDRALQITAELTERKDFRPVIQDILRVLKGGKPLADSLATHPECFAEFYVNMVRAGEATGSLAMVFERLAEYERTRDDLRSYIVSSMVYPALLTLVGLGSVFVLLYYVVPRFSQVFADSQLKMPTPTRVLLEFSAMVKAYGAWALGGLALAAAALRGWVATKDGRWWWDGFRLRIPLLGDALRKAETARFARAMGTLVANSVPLVQSLGIARAIMSNKRMAASLETVAQGVKRGEGLAHPLGRTGQFPPLAAHLLTIGEETGRIDAMFNRMAEIYDNDTRAAIKRFTSLFEPLIILVMGVMVGVLILSMLLAITSLNEVAV